MAMGGHDHIHQKAANLAEFAYMTIAGGYFFDLRAKEHKEFREREN